jgi:hypothetical protein
MFRHRKGNMDIINQYIARAKEIIGNRTPGEIKYDNEVVRWLRKGKGIKKAITKANEKFPSEQGSFIPKFLKNCLAVFFAI